VHADAPLDAAVMVSMGRQRLIASVLMPSLESAGNGQYRTVVPKPWSRGHVVDFESEPLQLPGAANQEKNQ